MESSPGKAGAGLWSVSAWMQTHVEAERILVPWAFMKVSPSFRAHPTCPMTWCLSTKSRERRKQHKRATLGNGGVERSWMTQLEELALAFCSTGGQLLLTTADAVFQNNYKRRLPKSPAHKNDNFGGDGDVYYPYTLHTCIYQVILYPIKIYKH
jgi:hypothetical protein